MPPLSSGCFPKHLREGVHSLAELFYIGEVWQVTESALVVQAESDNMLVGNCKTSVVRLNVYFSPVGLVKKSANPNRIRLARRQLLMEVGHRNPGVQDVFHDQKVGPLHPEAGVEEDFRQEG